MKPNDLKKLKLKVKSHFYNKLKTTHNCSNETYNSKIIESLIFNKNTHLAIVFKENTLFDFGDEFLKR